MRLSVAKRHGLIEAGGCKIRTGRIVAVLSVAKRHGLIEARRNAGMISPHSMLSVAKRHGLIEASATERAIRRVRDVIRGKTPRPH